MLRKNNSETKRFPLTVIIMKNILYRIKGNNSIKYRKLVAIIRFGQKSAGASALGSK
jgi:hypothetical protein